MNNIDSKGNLITDKKDDIVNEPVKGLTDEEIEKVSKICDKVDREAYHSEGLNAHSGGFATCDVEDYDAENIYLTLTYGIKNDVEDNVYTHDITVDRMTMEVWKD